MILAYLQIVYHLSSYGNVNLPNNMTRMVWPCKNIDVLSHMCILAYTHTHVHAHAHTHMGCPYRYMRMDLEWQAIQLAIHSIVGA